MIEWIGIPVEDTVIEWIGDDNYQWVPFSITPPVGPTGTVSSSVSGFNFISKNPDTNYYFDSKNPPQNYYFDSK